MSERSPAQPSEDRRRTRYRNAIHEDESTTARRVVARQTARNRRAERIADTPHARDVERAQQRIQPSRVRPDGPQRFLVAPPNARKIRHDDMEGFREAAPYSAPVKPSASSTSVNEKQRRASSPCEHARRLPFHFDRELANLIGIHEATIVANAVPHPNYRRPRRTTAKGLHLPARYAPCEAQPTARRTRDRHHP